MTGSRLLPSLLAGLSLALAAQNTPPPVHPAAQIATIPRVFGFRDFTQQSALDAEFLTVPDADRARQELKTLTSAPHWASSPEDYTTALYVAAQFRAAGLDTQIVPFRVWMNRPVSLLIDAFDATGNLISHGPTREHATPDPAAPTTRPSQFEDDPRILPGFNGSSPSGDATAQVVYANYGRQADFRHLADLGISMKGKIVLVRYGADFRGVKVYLAQQYGAVGVLIYSDPADDGAQSGRTWPAGPYRPDAAVQRGSVQFMPIYPGDPTTPGLASTPDLSAARRIPANRLQSDQPSIPVNPLSSADAAPILRAMSGPAAPSDWQGGLPFPYHLGATASVSVHMRLVQDARLRTIWDVIGTIPGSSDPAHSVLAGSHRDAWVYGAADPGSGSVAILEAVRGLGVLLKQGWRPKRTIVIASWDAEEEGLIGSTEWTELHAAELVRAVAYFNIDVAVSGPVFNAAAVPSLRQFLREITIEVASPAGGTVYDRWKHDEESGVSRRAASQVSLPIADQPRADPEPHLGDLGSGSDYTPFLQHLGIPSTDIGSDGPFGVYHTAFDNFDWFSRFADPTFAYTRQQAQIIGLEILHMADADVLPFDYRVYAQQIREYLDQARSHAVAADLHLDLNPALAATARFEAAAATTLLRQQSPPADPATLNRALCSAERALLLPAGLPGRPWYRHSIYAPGVFTGYAAVPIPGITEAIEQGEAPQAQRQLDQLTHALDRATAALLP